MQCIVHQKNSAYCVYGSMFAKETQELEDRLLFRIQFELVKRKRNKEENREDE